MKRVLVPVAILTSLFLAACGGSSSDQPSAGGNPPPPPPPPPPAAVAPSITAQPAAASVTAPATATFTVTATGTAPLAYQWRSSPDGTTWTNIAGATGASYDTAATDAGMNDLLYSVVVTNSAGSVTSGGARLTVTLPTGGGDPPDPTGPSGVFPHAANPQAIAATAADTALATIDVGSSADSTIQSPGGAADIAVADGITVSLGFPGNTFLEDQSLAVTSVTLSGTDAGHPLPFQSVMGAFLLAPADTNTPELQASNAVRLTFMFTQAALDALGGSPVIFTAAADGTQVHLVPVYPNGEGSWSTTSLTAATLHLGIFGVATLDGAQAASLANAWPTDVELQLESALAVPSYQARAAGLVAQTSSIARRAQLKQAMDAQDSTDWWQQQKAASDAYYNDVITPALNAANAPGADLIDFQNATRLMLGWERQRALLDIQEGIDATVSTTIIDFFKRGLDIAMEDCSTNRNAAATVEVLGMARQLALFGIETTVSLDTIMNTCGNTKFEMAIDWTQVHTINYDLLNDVVPSTAMTGKVRSQSTLTGKMKVADSIKEVTAQSLEYLETDVIDCADGAYYCEDQNIRSSASEGTPSVSYCNGEFYTSMSVTKWNLDARGHTANPLIHFQIDNRCPGESFRVGTNAMTEVTTDPNGSERTRVIPWSDGVDAAYWAGDYRLGSTSKIARHSKPITGQTIVAPAGERWSTTLAITVTEVPRN